MRRPRKNGAERWIRYQYLKLVRINDSAEKIAGGLTLGVVLGILPTFGLGIILAIFLAAALKLNRASAVIGTLIMNPWTAPFVWTLSYLAGSLLLGYDLNETLIEIRSLNAHPGLWRSLMTGRLIKPYIIGNLTVMAALASFFYAVVLFSVRAYRNAKKRNLLEKRKK
jgi:uncharacterized protein (DUF2062 family)